MQEKKKKVMWPIAKEMNVWGKLLSWCSRRINEKRNKRRELKGGRKETVGENLRNCDWLSVVKVGDYLCALVICLTCSMLNAWLDDLQKPVATAPFYNQRNLGLTA